MKWPTIRDVGVTAVRVAGVVVPIEWVEAFPDPAQYGEWDDEHCVIRLKSGLRAREQWRTLAHERMHALAYLAGLNWMTEREEEALVQAFAADLIGYLETTPVADLGAALRLRVGGLDAETSSH